MSKLRVFLPLFLFFTFIRLPQSTSTTITLLSTTDSHGHLLAWDYSTAKPAPYALDKVATLIAQQRAAAPHALLLDCGDTTEGTPLLYYFVKKETGQPNPAIAAFNALHYDAMAVGNHEFNFGLTSMWKAKSESHFPWLAANLKQTYAPTDPGYIAPYIILTVDGVRVAIVGFVTPGVVRWELPENYQGYEFEPILDAAQKIIPEARAKSDLLVVIMHSGIDHDPDQPERTVNHDPRVQGENAALQIAENVPGIDVIFYGHTHLEKPQLKVNGVLLAQAKNWGGSLARADVQMQKDDSGTWHVTEKHSTDIDVTADTPENLEIKQLVQPYHDATEKYLSTVIATSDATLDGTSARYQDSALVDLIHRAQLDAAHAQASFATLFNPETTIHSGPVTIRDMFALYPYENILYAIELTGAQLKDALEHAASMLPAWRFPEGKREQLGGYSFDSAEGVSYDINLTNPRGSRIVDLRFHDKPVTPAQKFRVAVNNYRYTGGGEYRAFENTPVLWRSDGEIRDLVIEYLQRGKKFPLDLPNNWRVQPPEAREAIDMEAKLEKVSREH
jgi:2',3'-cyclic-nucleotide 2'-phosphodiesterase/3'-nucleotidase